MFSDGFIFLNHPGVITYTLYCILIQFFLPSIYSRIPIDSIGGGRSNLKKVPYSVLTSSKYFILIIDRKIFNLTLNLVCKMSIHSKQCTLTQNLKNLHLQSKNILFIQFLIFILPVNEGGGGVGYDSIYTYF